MPDRSSDPDASGPAAPPPSTTRSTARLGLELGGSVFKLIDGRVYGVGSADDADVRLVHASIAPRHARLFLDGETIVVEGLAAGSDAGARRVARPGETLTLGALRLKVVDAVAIATARAAKAGRREPTFHELVGAELARAPWFLLSIAIHVLILLLLIWFVPTTPPGQSPYASAKLLQPAPEDDLLLDVKPEEKVEVEDTTRTEDRQAAANDSKRFEPELTRLEPEFDPSAFDGFNTSGLAASVKRGGGGTGDIFDLGSDALKSGGFRGTVARLRGTGLEIVFVFDSTGSMDSVLSAAKRRIFRMVEVLNALVPSARIGIVTYRDHGATEQYVTRAVPVTHDVYRVMNFMHTIEANGGGDFAEAVLDGLKEATSQRWQSNSRRVVVLIGDAPPHKEDEAAIRNMLASFARGEATVHTIASAEDRRKRTANPDTKRTFEAIAKTGKGQFSMLEAEDTILTQVLSLAFGPEYRKDLEEIYALVDTQTKRTDVVALDAVQREDLQAIERALRRPVVDQDFIKAIITLAPPPVLRFLAEKLGDRGFPVAGRQAAAFALMKALELRRPPIDPENDEPLPRAGVEALLRKIR